MCHANKEKMEKTNIGRNRINKSRKIRKFGEKETFKYIGILESNTIKQVKMKEKFKKGISEERKKHSKPNYITRISLKR